MALIFLPLAFKFPQKMWYVLSHEIARSRAIIFHIVWHIIPPLDRCSMLDSQHLGIRKHLREFPILIPSSPYNYFRKKCMMQWIICLVECERHNKNYGHKFEHPQNISPHYVCHPRSEVNNMRIPIKSQANVGDNTNDVKLSTWIITGNQQSVLQP